MANGDEGFAMGDLASPDPDQLARERAIRFRTIGASNMSIQPGISIDYPDERQTGPPLGVPANWQMGAIAAQDQYRPLGNDPWTGLMAGQRDLPLGGPPFRDPNSPVLYKTASPLVNITQGDIENASDLGLMFSGGGLKTEPPRSNINWNREATGLGKRPLAPGATVMDIPVRDLEAAHKATDPEAFIETPRKQVVEHMAAGNPISLPEVSVYEGQLRYTNGRNRVAAARELGADTIPVAVEGESVGPLHELLAKNRPPAAMGSILGTEPSAPAILPRQNPTAEDIAAIKAAAVQYGRKGWPEATREVFQTTPEAYAETTALVPQVSIKERLPGPEPGERLPLKERAAPIVAHTEQIADRIAERLDPLVRRQDPLLKFYHTGPVIRGLQQYGEQTLPEANQFMRNWAGQGAATSPRTQTPPNLRNASYLLNQRAMGEPITPERYAAEGNIPGFPMMGMHVNLADAFARGAENPWLNPKPTVFRENWSGNLRDITADTHNIRSTLFEMDQVAPGSLPRGWFTSDAAYAKYRKEGFAAVDAGDIADTLGDVTVKKIRRQSEYLPMAAPWYRAAEKLGIAPAEGQSGGWFTYGGITGLQSPPKTIPNLLNDQISATAKALNVPEEKVVQWWSRGQIPLAGIAGIGAMGELARQDQYDTP